MSRRAKVVFAVLVVLLGLDMGRAPERQLTAKALLAAIDLYQATFSKALSSVGAQCRFAPTCSHYGEEVIRRHGALEGSWKAIGRVARCGPWTALGTYDPPQ